LLPRVLFLLSGWAQGPSLRRLVPYGGGLLPANVISAQRMGTRPIPTKTCSIRRGLLPPLILPTTNSGWAQGPSLRGLVPYGGVCSLPMLFLLSGWAQGPSLQGLVPYGGGGHPCHGDFRSDLINQFYSSHGYTYMISTSFEPKGFYTVRDFFIKHALNMLW